MASRDLIGSLLTADRLTHGLGHDQGRQIARMVFPAFVTIRLNRPYPHGVATLFPPYNPSVLPGAPAAGNRVAARCDPERG